MNNISMKEHYQTKLVFNFDMDQFEAIQKLDKSYVGTSNYMGLAYFWDHEVKHCLRDATHRDMFEQDRMRSGSPPKYQPEPEEW